MGDLMATNAGRAITAEELFHYPNHDRYELVAGSLRVSEPPGGAHGQVAMRLGYRLHGFVEAHGLGVVLVESGFILRRGPDTVRGPDVSFVASDRLDPERIPASYIPLAPDLAIEILSPEDRPGEVAEKVANYLDAGTKLVWVVDAKAREVFVHRADRSITRLGAADWLEGEGVIPGLRCLVAEFVPAPAGLS